MLEPEQEAAAVLVVTQHRASLMPGRRLTRTVAANCILAHRMGKGQTAKHAPGRREESDATPAPTAQGIRLIDDLAAGKAVRRQHAVDERPADPSQPIGSPRGKGCRCLHHDTSSGCGRIRQLPSLFSRYCPRGPPAYGMPRIRTPTRRRPPIEHRDQDIHPEDRTVRPPRLAIAPRPGGKERLRRLPA